MTNDDNPGGGHCSELGKKGRPSPGLHAEKILDLLFDFVGGFVRHSLSTLRNAGIGSSGHQARERGEPSLIAEITRRVVGEYGIDQARIYVAGLSAGGAARGLSRSLCCRWCACLACGSAHDVRFQRDARIGKQREQPRPYGSETHNRVPRRYGRNSSSLQRCKGDCPRQQETNLWAQTEGKISPKGKSFSHSVHRDSSGLSILELWEPPGAGHSWSGDSLAGSFASEDGPNASREMSRFFLQHRLPKS